MSGQWTITRQNAQLHCRTCLRALVDVAYDMEESPELINWLERLLPLVSLFRGEDQIDYPHLVCLECYAKLNEFNGFHDMVCRSTDVLDSIFNENKAYVAVGDNNGSAVGESDVDVVTNGSTTFRVEIASEGESTDTCSETGGQVKHTLANSQAHSLQIAKQQVNGGSSVVSQKLITAAPKVVNGIEVAKGLNNIKYIVPLQQSTTVINRKSYKCSKCERKFLDKYSCIMHIRSCQLLGNQEECFECEICHKNYHKIGHLNRHKRMEHEDLCPLKCEYVGCNFIFRSDEFRQCHYEMFHVNELKKSLDNGASPANDPLDDEESTKAVASIQMRDDTAQSLDSTVNETADESEHLEDMETEVTEEDDDDEEEEEEREADDGVVNDSEELEKPEVKVNCTSVRKPYRSKCSICQEEFKMGKDLSTHIATQHSDKLQYSCTVCTRRFLCQANLTSHMAVTHAAKNMSCKLCTKVFRTDAELKKHISRVHHGVRPYACRFCATKFGVRASRDRHEVTHTGQKPYACDVCDRSFSYAHSVKKHKRTHEKGRLKDI